MDHMIKDDEKHIYGRKLKNSKEPINGMVFGPKKEKEKSSLYLSITVAMNELLCIKNVGAQIRNISIYPGNFDPE